MMRCGAGSRASWSVAARASWGPPPGAPPRARPRRAGAGGPGRRAPSARVAVAHGQMPEESLESVIVAFMEGRVDVLVTTTIIESGVDIPNANTLIVYRAESFGLADLYQLPGRGGRVGREGDAGLSGP